VTRFQITIRCTICDHRYKRTMEAPDESALEELPDPPCPQCKKVAERRVFDYQSGKAPGVIGAPVTKAIDYAMEGIAQDYGMTDIRDNVKEGESAAPKLPPRQQVMADNFFARPKGRRGAQMGGLFSMPTRAVMAAAVNGRFNSPDTANPIAMQHAAKDAAPVRIVAGDGVKGAT
jgi:hypothetical protein